MDDVRKQAGVDILLLADEEGTTVRRSHRPELTADSGAMKPLLDSVLAGQDAASGTWLVAADDLAVEDPALAVRARIAVLPTPRAAPSREGALSEGMLMGAASAVRLPDGRRAGVLLAATLLNGNWDLVDQVRNVVFKDEKYEGRPVGPATLFQHDVRISTNVLLANGARAVGTRVSAEVGDEVLGRGRAWVGPAWVLDDWYISAYSPLHDVRGRPIGMIYVGVLQRKFDRAAFRTFGVFASLTLAGILAGGLVAWRLAARIARPIGNLARASVRISQGDFAQTLPVESQDEIGALTEAFNTMARSLHERDELLKERTRQQLTRTERLAAIGRLAAGVAHEINNPLTGVLTFAHMLLREAPEGSRQREDAQTIVEATLRCRDIVQGLLNFSRQNEPHKRRADLNALLRKAVNLTQNQAALSQVKVVQELDPALPHLVLDPNQVQEVAVNLIVNAVDAMPHGGEMRIRTRAVREDGRDWAEVEVADTGCGIPPENLDRIFDPFFTTKQSDKGTGLGLAVSYGIVTEHGGQIRVASKVGEGTTMTVRLPLSGMGETNGVEAAHSGGG
jgi:two-component system NtrC family sensor kinase